MPIFMTIAKLHIKTVPRAVPISLTIQNTHHIKDWNHFIMK